MKTKLISASLVAAGFLTLGAIAQVAVPSPAPVVTTAAAPAPGRIIYAPRLPSPIELTNVAAAQGLSVERIDQTASQITVTYKSADGQASTVAYQLLPTAATPGSTSVVAVPTPAPTVVYVEEPYARPYPFYAYNDPYYNPWGFYGPMALGIGLGLGFHGHYGYYGGFHYGHHRGHW